jgi:protein O-mannosyl-transferase
LRSETPAAKTYSGPLARFSKDPVTLLLCLALAAIILVVYLPAGSHTFFILDENDHVTENPYVANGLTGAGIIWAFTSVAAFNWHPVTWLSHMTVAQFYGMDPGAHHLANVLIHTAASVVLFLLFLRVTGARWQSLFVAALFALHPLHVESVAWVAERKDVLSALFGFLTLLCYAQRVTKPSKPGPYSLPLVFFILGLMSKSMLVTLPLIMLLMDFWPLSRYRQDEQAAVKPQRFTRLAQLIGEKIPFFALSLAAGLLAIYAQHKGGATKGLEAVPFALRLENALVAYAKYLFKTLWPVDLGVLYPIPASFALWQVAGSLIVVLSISAAVVRARHNRPYLLVGWFWFLVTLLPVIGLIQVGSQSMADRYTYIPGIGLFIMAAWGVTDLFACLPYRRVVLSLSAGMVIIALAALAHRQLGYWRDSLSILRHTLQVTRGNYLVNDMIGITLAKKGDLDAALLEFQAAVRINPNDPAVRRNLGVILAEKGDPDGAIRQFQAALRIQPGDVRTNELLTAAIEQKRGREKAGK